MLKIWTFAFICITVYTNVVVCDETDLFRDASIDLIKNLPKYFNDAVLELDNEESAKTNTTISERIHFPRLPKLPKISQCLKDYLRMYTLLRADTRSWAFEGIHLKLNGIFNKITCLKSEIKKEPQCQRLIVDKCDLHEVKRR